MFLLSSAWSEVAAETPILSTGEGKVLGTRNALWVASALWAVAAVVAVMDGEIAQTLGWIVFVVAGVLLASGATEGNRNASFLSTGLLVVGVVISPATSYPLDHRGLSLR
jgi:hypothetical protein